MVSYVCIMVSYKVIAGGRGALHLGYIDCMHAQATGSLTSVVKFQNLSNKNGFVK